MKTELVPLGDLPDDQALAIGSLLARVWVKPEKGPAERAAQIQAAGQLAGDTPQRGPLSVIVREGDAVVAHALTFCRVIGTQAGELPVMALALVGSDPERRGEGLGAQVVRGAFERVDAGDFPYCLFQTSHAVRPFYERIGCELVENRVVNSLDEADPMKNPFWDEVVMRYASPEAGDWPAGDLDLRGRGY